MIIYYNICLYIRNIKYAHLTHNFRLGTQYAFSNLYLSTQIQMDFCTEKPVLNPRFQVFWCTNINYYLICFEKKSEAKIYIFWNKKEVSLKKCNIPLNHLLWLYLWIPQILLRIDFLLIELKLWWQQLFWNERVIIYIFTQMWFGVCNKFKFKNLLCLVFINSY